MLTLIKKKQKRDKLTDLLKHISQQDSIYADSPSSDVYKECLSLQSEVNTLTADHAVDQLLKSRSNYYVQGDKASRLPAHQQRQAASSHPIPPLEPLNEKEPVQTFDLVKPELDTEIRPQVRSYATQLQERSLSTEHFQRFSSFSSLVQAIALLIHIARSNKPSNSVRDGISAICLLSSKGNHHQSCPEESIHKGVWSFGDKQTSPSRQQPSSPQSNLAGQSHLSQRRRHITCQTLLCSGQTGPAPDGRSNQSSRTLALGGKKAHQLSRTQMCNHV